MKCKEVESYLSYRWCDSGCRRMGRTRSDRCGLKHIHSFIQLINLFIHSFIHTYSTYINALFKNIYINKCQFTIPSHRAQYLHSAWAVVRPLLPLQPANINIRSCQSKLLNKYYAYIQCIICIVYANRN